MSREVTEESFLKDVAKHEIKVLLDNGIYRHLRFASTGEHSWNQWFEIVTWPGYLTYTGDMGSFVFARLEDMFQFFRTDRKDGHLGINLSYWGEKLEAVDRSGRESGFRIFSPESLKEHVEERINMWVEEFDAPYDASAKEEKAARKVFEIELREAIDEDIYRFLGDGEHEAQRALHDFSFTSEEKRFDRNPHKYEFLDTWEWNCEEYTGRFVWCCYALAWSIQKYDALKVEGSEMSNRREMRAAIREGQKEADKQFALKRQAEASLISERMFTDEECLPRYFEEVEGESK